MNNLVPCFCRSVSAANTRSVVNAQAQPKGKLCVWNKFYNLEQSQKKVDKIVRQLLATVQYTGDTMASIIRYIIPILSSSA